jgi:hypothetical protein
VRNLPTIVLAASILIGCAFKGGFMRIRKEFAKKGMFWLPSNPDKKIPGTLTITDGGDIELEVVGLFGREVDLLKKDDDLSRILGNIEEHGLVTLDDCFYRTWNITFGGLSHSRISVRRVYCGIAYDEKEIPYFNTFSFSVEGIDEWVGITGIRAEVQLKPISATISYAPPQEITINLNNSMTLLIGFAWTLPGRPIVKEAKITQSTYFKLTSAEKRELGEFTAAAHKITNLLCFTIDETVCIENVIATSDDIQVDIGEGRRRPVQINIYYPSLPFSKKEPKIDAYSMLFRFVQKQQNGEKIFNNWFRAYDEVDTALNLYLSTQADAYKYHSGQFLALAQSFETYHRRTSDETYMDKIEFKNLVDAIISTCPEDKKEWLRRRLAYGNEVSFRNRIKKVIDPFRSYLETNQDREEFITKLISSITDTRNYLTHYDEALRHKAATGRDLWRLCLRMEAIFQLHLLQRLGFAEEEIKEIVNRNSTLKRKLSAE